ncbi:MAG: hypothetical protein NTV86_20715, partial [Planctomycetota bacterium]|nr:hypothetical protein [Planctomycetota bacterium]
MRKFRLSSQSVLILLALCVAGGMFALDGLFLQPFLVRQGDHAIARAARAGQQAAALQLQAEETSLRAWCQALAGGQAVAGGAGGEPVLKPAGDLSHV